jgi:hypothetical protein
MAPGDDDPVLQLVDLVLYDLAFGGPMYVGRRPGAAAPGRVMIQSGEEGRREFALPDLSSPRSVETFVAELQAHISDVHNTPVPACPVDSHNHALLCRAGDSAVRCVCPNAEWSSPIGEYDERNWPPADLDAEDVPDRAMDRIFRRDIDALREAHHERLKDGWVIRAGVWPMTDAVTAQLREIAAPVTVEVYLQPGQWYAAQTRTRCVRSILQHRNEARYERHGAPAVRVPVVRPWATTIGSP